MVNIYLVCLVLSCVCWPSILPQNGITAASIAVSALTTIVCSGTFMRHNFDVE